MHRKNGLVAIELFRFNRASSIMQRVPRMAGFRGKVVRPLLCWFVVSLGLLLWRNHEQQERRAAIQFRVSLEGRSGQPEYQAELNQLAFTVGSRSGLGRKKLTVLAADAEPFTTNLFVWHGGKHLGNITLSRNRGMLDVSTKPAALRLSVDGAEPNNSFSNTAHESISLPTGRYKISATFARFTTNQEVEIVAHQMSRALINPGITALRLSSQPTNAEFELKSVIVEGVLVRSNTPVTLTDLPAGAYQLRIWREDYQKTVPFELNASQPTNELQIEFDYAQVTLTSQPDGALIREGEKIIGTSPATLTLPAGLHHLSVGKTGFRSTNFTVTLEAETARTFAVMLPNLASIEALERARGHFSGFNTDFGRALEEVNRALELQPGDPETEQLKQAIVFQKHLYDARELRRRGEHGRALIEVEAALKQSATNTDALSLKRDLEKEFQSAAQAQSATRREHPGRIFQDLVSRLPHHDLFPSQKFEIGGQKEAARAALVRALGVKPAWSIRRNDTLDQDTAIIQAEVKSLGSRQSVFFLVGQTTDNEVVILFKLWEFTLGSNIQFGITGIADESYKPLHPSFAPAQNAASIEQRRTRNLEAFRKRIQSELR